MNGWINEARSKPDKDVWQLVLDTGPGFTKAGKPTRRQKWVRFRGTRKQAEQHIEGLCVDARRGDFIEPTKITLGAWLDEWLKQVVKPRAKQSPRTYAIYENAIRNHLKPKLGGIRLQQLRPMDIERYHADAAATLSAATRKVHHNVLRQALQVAMENELVRRNITPRRRKLEQGGIEKVKAWDTPDVRKVVTAAKLSSVQTRAFVEFALDTGARKGELQGLRWSDVDLQAGTVTIVRQLLRGGPNPVFGPTKTRNVRTINVSTETVASLREHKRTQSELKLANRLHYADHGLVFAQAWEHQNSRGAKLGAPLAASSIAALLERLIKESGVPRITVHGLRHTSATLSLKAGTPAHVVQRRLGHDSIQTTLNLYAHALPSMQEDAASRLSALLHG